MSLLGTEWVGPGEGSTDSEILEAIGRDLGIFTEIRATGRKTNLRLNGRPLQGYDLNRIAQVEMEP